MPVLNPDGLNYSWENLRLWRKNRRPHNCSGIDPIKSYPEHAAEVDVLLYPNDETECYGVDLNRNFDISFGNNDGNNFYILRGQ